MSENAGQTRTQRPQILKGFRDQLPAQMIRRRQVIDRFRAIYERHGFEPIDTPALEYMEVLTGKAGENEKLMYHFTDQGEREVGLRYDLTVPLARFTAVHESELVFPFKRYHIAPVWRAEKPQRGRFREFWQCDADVVGSASTVADAEVVAIMAEALISVGLPNFEILISHRRLLEGIGKAAGVPPELAGGIYRAVDKLAKIGPGGVLTELTEAGVAEDAARKVIDAVSQTGGTRALIAGLRERLAGESTALAALDELATLFDLLEALGVPERSARLDVSLARGLDYYTGCVFEATVTEPKVGSLAGGGRYDGLVGSMLGRQLPATGMSLGIERIIEVVEQFNLIPSGATVAQVFVAAFPETLALAAGIARELREAGLNVDFSLNAQKGLGDQMKYAARKGVPVVVIPGENELANGQVAIKTLATGAQELVAIRDLAERLHEAVTASS